MKKYHDAKLKPNQRSAVLFYNRNMIIMEPWLPPTLAFVFVLSFELSRRKRQVIRRKSFMSTERVMDGVIALTWSDSESIQC